MLLRVGGAAAVRKGVLLCAAGLCAACAACAVCAFAKRAETRAACRMQEARIVSLAGVAAVAVCAGGFMRAKGVNERWPCVLQLLVLKHGLVCRGRVGCCRKPRTC